MNMTKLETVDVRQGVVGRMLGFGTVLIIGIGSSWEPLALGPEPEQPNRKERIERRIRTQRTNRGIGVLPALERLF